jgi:diadenosine tetraphosphate (Ap4A) HIT family hydrolase
VRMVVVVCTRVFTASSPGSPGIPTQWFTAYGALSPEIGLSCLRRLRRLLRKLDAGVEASGPHGFAVRFGAVRRRHLHVHRIPSRVRDDREPPLRWDGTAIICEVIWVGREVEYFSKEDWTGGIGLIRFNKLRRARQTLLGQAVMAAMLLNSTLTASTFADRCFIQLWSIGTE